MMRAVAIGRMPAAIVCVIVLEGLIAANSEATENPEGVATLSDAEPRFAATRNVRLHHKPHDEGIVDALHEHHRSLHSDKERAEGSILLHNYKNT